MDTAPEDSIMNAERQKVPGGELYDLMDAELEWQPPVRR
jgi:hypothetical protein